MRRRALLAGAALLGALASSRTLADELVERPPLLPASPRHFGRTLRPVEPRAVVVVAGSQLWGGEHLGVTEARTTAALLLELAWRGIGVFLEAPVVLDTARTQGVYGEGTATARGAGDLRFGVDVTIRRWHRRRARWLLGADLQASAPTGGARRVRPRTPFLPAPDHIFGPARWTVSVGPAAAVRAGRLSLQLNGDILVHRLDTPSEGRTSWLFAGVALTGGFRITPWLVALLQLEAQLELYGRHSLRQLPFAAPAIRLRATRRITLEVAARLPLWREAWDEQHLTIGAALAVGAGPRGDHAW
jgi:hypothetical protein